MSGAKGALLEVLLLCAWPGFAFNPENLSCFADAILPEQRRNVSNGEESYPIGLFIMDWDAAHATSAMVEILIEE